MRGFTGQLSNGLIVYEENIKDYLSQYVAEYNMQSSAPWVFLKEHLKRQNLKLINLELQFDHQGVFLPRHARAYFYSKKVEAYLGGTQDQILYYGVGASDRAPDEVEITWYDGNNSQIENRKVNAENPAFIVN